jgi:D-threo-aldose 1-dehydrogenase
MSGVPGEDRAPRPLGTTSVQLTQLGYGSSGLGELFVKVSDGQAQATLEAAWNAGVRYFDTAPYYGHGLAEHRVGDFLRGVPREEFVVSTKVGRLLRTPRDPGNPMREPWCGGLPFEHDFDYSYAGVKRSLEDSLQRLGLERVDLLLIHDLDLHHHGDDTGVAARLDELSAGGWQALVELKAEGVIRAIGAGINSSEMMPRLLERFELDFFLVALPYTLLDQGVLDLEFPLCVERRVGVIVGAVYASGILATGAVPGATYAYEPATPEMMSRVAAIERVAQRHGVSLRAAALQFPLAHPSVASVIPGAITPGEALQNATALHESVATAFWDELKSAGLLRSDAPVPPSTRPSGS